MAALLEYGAFNKNNKKGKLEHCLWSCSVCILQSMVVKMQVAIAAHMGQFGSVH